MAPDMAHEGGESKKEDAQHAEGVEEIMPNYEEQACTSFEAERVFVEQSPRHGAGFGNFMLQLGLNVLVGERVLSFTAKSPMKYFSPVGHG